jgi:pimeloyl-ACP methyl ester carboxylesterase
MMRTLNVKRFCLVILLVLGISIGVLSAQAPQIPAGFVGKFIQVRGMQIRYHQVGSGPDILLIHGLPGSIEDWQTVIGPLSSWYRVTVYDRPGNGFSSDENAEYSLAQNAEVALGLIEELHLDNPIVVGHSYGGGISLQMAENRPERIKAIVNIGGCAFDDEKSDAIFYLLRIPLLGRLLISLIPKSTGCGMIRDGILQAFEPNTKNLPADYVDSRCKLWSQPRAIITMAREDVRLNADIRKIIPAYKNIAVPFFLVHGKQDRLVPVEDSRKLSAILPHAQLFLLEDTGHMVQYTRTKELIQVIMSAAQGTLPQK